MDLNFMMPSFEPRHEKLAFGTYENKDADKPLHSALHR